MATSFAKRLPINRATLYRAYEAKCLNNIGVCAQALGENGHSVRCYADARTILAAVEGDDSLDAPLVIRNFSRALRNGKGRASAGPNTLTREAPLAQGSVALRTFLKHAISAVRQVSWLLQMSILLWRLQLTVASGHTPAC